ncbi:aldose epimerase family protein, partial [candidate division KSB1 bacterium]
DLDGENSIQFSYISPDGDEGYPGQLDVTVIYTLTEDSEFRIDYSARSEEDTIVNLTHHSYFNLRGSSDIFNHELMINADKFTPVAPDLLPTGDYMPVVKTPLDFWELTPIGKSIGGEIGLLIFGNGYDHSFVLNNPGALHALAARVREPFTGRVMEVFTTEPGLHLYTGNYLDGISGKNGLLYRKHAGFCLEAQRFPDSPNHPRFPSAVVREGEEYRQTTIYRFSTD